MVKLQTKNYSYENLITLEDTIIHEIKYQTFFEDNEYIENKKVKEILKKIKNENPILKNNYLNEYINLTTKGLEHYFQTRISNKTHNLYNDYLTIVNNIDKILPISIPVNELNIRKKNIKKTYILCSIVKFDKKIYAVRFIANKYIDEILGIDFNNLHSINKKEGAEHNLTLQHTPSTISISSFLEIAIRNPLLRNVLLSIDVLDHFNLEREINDKVSNNVIY